jgi:hypothetical protein
VIEGMDDSFCDGIELTFVGAKVSCPACNSVGMIVAHGPRFPDSWFNKQAALENDLCGCKCYPPPLMHASQSGMFESFEANELATMGFDADGMPISVKGLSQYWVRFQSNEPGRFEGVRCVAHFADGTTAHGVFDANNIVHFERPNESTCQKMEFIFDSATENTDSVTARLLSLLARGE